MSYIVPMGAIGTFLEGFLLDPDDARPDDPYQPMGFDDAFVPAVS